jgi:hypothetical protein
MSWARKRKFIYIGSIIIFVLVFIVLPTVIHFYKAPTCSDGKQNQDELGIDCGGSCTLLCRVQYAPLNVLWSRFSKVDDGVYNVLAYVENPNLNAEAYNLDYVFKLYDKDGILLRERYGRTFAPANKIMTVFEPELKTGKQIPVRVEFVFSSQAVWLKQDSSINNFTISQSVMSREDSSPRLTAVIANKTINQIKNIEAVGIVYGADGNTIAFSRTVIDVLEGKGSKEINFNWPKPFSGIQVRTEIVLKVLK